MTALLRLQGFIRWWMPGLEEEFLAERRSNLLTTHQVNSFRVRIRTYVVFHYLLAFKDRTPHRVKIDGHQTIAICVLRTYVPLRLLESTFAYLAY